MASYLEYAFCYCEENVYKCIEKLLTENKSVDKGYAVVMSSFCCDASAEQLNKWTSVVPYRPFKTAVLAEDVTLWDYHVIAVIHSADTSSWYVIDLDSRIPATTDVGLGPLSPYCVDLHTYVTRTLFFDSALTGSAARQLTALLDRVQYRVLEWEDYVSQLRTDRSHMMTSLGAYTEEPPQWLPISAASSAAGPEARRRGEAAVGALPIALRSNNLVSFINMSNSTIFGTVVDRHAFLPLFHL